ncbi:OmpA family protein [Leptospira langatensis]|uniref:OmpA family protein n=1 Tax=Leptospira langatensis TaxID=2484983 RepID=A0A5F1ZS81_9LEPT|nr:OmpA family protein [Leptospira langatensis]TGK01759.1 OmpA family protein [Leptospira langatensis]TGL39365.1 OmpA family protein [Leptospira langatensis]
MTKKQNYYVTIKGKKFDRGLIELADEATSGKRDGRISINDAKRLLNAVKDNNTYTDIEKKTMEYIRENYKFTEKADEWFRTEIRKWAAEKSSHSKSGEQEEYTSHDEAIGLMVPHSSDLHSKGYSGYIPTPSAGQPKKQSRIPVLILSLIILFGFGIGVYYAFRKKPNSHVPSSESVEAKKKAPKVEPEVVEKKKSEGVPSSENKGFFDFLSDKKEPAQLAGKDAELAAKIQSSPIFFDKNDIKVPHSHRRALDSLSFLLKKHSDIKALLTGHASQEGTERANLKVSRLRAEMVRDYLLGNGIESSRLILEAKGSEQLGQNKNSEAAKEKSRRVDIQIVK